MPRNVLLKGKKNLLFSIKNINHKKKSMIKNNN